MITLKNCISNLNFNYILFGFIFISFFYIKNLINKLTDLHRLNIIILNKLYNKIKSISKKNKKNHHKLNKKFKKIKKIIKNISNNESNKIIKVIPTTPTTLINNIEQNQSNCITIDVENEFEFVD
jgi:predicted PurR-regulated permease PerM